MMNADKLQAVRMYINDQFPPPSHLVSDTYDSENLCQLFRIDKGGELLHRLVVSEEFLEAHDEKQVAAVLDESLPDVLERAGTTRVVITRQGPKIDGTG